MEINKKYGYIRVSSKSQESNSSIKYQKEFCKLMKIILSS